MAEHAIWLVDRSKLFREGLKMLLRDSSFEITEELTHLDLARALMNQSAPHPELILAALPTRLDLASEEATQLKQLCQSTETPVVILSDAMSLTQLRIAMQAGACGYLLRDIAPDALKQSLMLVLAGEKVLPSELVAILVSEQPMQPAAHVTALSSNLSSREQHILDCLAHGYPNKAIAKHLDIAEGTVKVHVKAVFKKIHARNRTEAAIWARSRGYGLKNSRICSRVS